MQYDAQEMSSDTEHDQGNVRRRPPQRSCRQRTDRFVLEQALEEVEDYQKQTDQRTLRLKEKNKRAQQRFRERQREKSKTIAVQAIKLQQEVKDLRQKLAEAEKAAAEDAAPAVLIKETEGGVVKMEAFEPYLGWSVLPGVEAVHTLVLRNPRAPQSLSKRDIQELTPEQLNILLKGYVEEMTAALLDAGGNEFSPSVQHLQGLNDEMFALFALAHKMAPRSMMQRLREGNEPSPLDVQAICNVLRDAGLTGKQAQQLVSARVSCLATLATLMKERHAMCKNLEMVVSGGSSWENFVSSHASMLDLQHRLVQNMEAENGALYTFMEAALRTVLNPIQTASITVRSYPCLPIVFPLVPLLADCSQDDPTPFPGQSDHLISCLSTATSAQLPDAVHMFDASDSLGQSLDALFTDIYAL